MTTFLTAEVFVNVRCIASFLLLALHSAGSMAATPAAIRAKVEHDHPGLIPAEAMDRAFGYLADHDDKVGNKNYLTIIDFTRPSTVKRCHVIDLRSGEVESLLVAHARNTGVDRAEHFSNENGSNKSSLGIYLTGELYQGKHGLSMRLDGMEPTNDNASAVARTSGSRSAAERTAFNEMVAGGPTVFWPMSPSRNAEGRPASTPACSSIRDSVDLPVSSPPTSKTVRPWRMARSTSASCSFTFASAWGVSPLPGGPVPCVRDRVSPPGVLLPGWADGWP